MKHFISFITFFMILLGIFLPSKAQKAYTISELSLERDGQKIYGEIYLPESSGKLPMVILSHGFGGNRNNVTDYAEIFAENGIAAYVFDFIGGGKNIKSDGATTEMSILTEAADLNQIIDYFKTDERFDSSAIFLFGESQGGFVSTYVAGNRPEDVAGLVVLYPAYVIRDDAEKRIENTENIPEVMNLMGTPIGRIYMQDALSVDIYDVMAAYIGKTLIIHGTADSIVPVEYSRRAVSTFSDADLITIEGANHGFWGADEREAADSALDFITQLLNEKRNSTKTVDAVTSATLNIHSLPKVESNGDSNVLVVYFSTNDTIRAAALTAAEVIGADIFEIVPVEPYTEDDLNYHQPGNRAGQEQWSGARPEIVSLPENLDRYDTILLGYPIWGGQAPNILYTFLENVEIHNVVILPFCTSNFVSPGSSAINLSAATDESVVWLPAQRIENQSTEEDLVVWAESLGIQGKEENHMRLFIGETEVPVTWEKNSSVDALKEIAPLTVHMSMYGGFEQVGAIGQSIVRDDRQTVTDYGDIVLYSGNQIVIFYGSNSWAYTRLGHIDYSRQQMTDLLSHGDVTITIRMDQ